MTQKNTQTSAEKLAALRGELKKRGLDGFIVPRTDEFQGEYVPPCAERLAWLTGFTGSAGVAIALQDKAVVMSDGRYTEQLAQQVDAKAFDRADSTAVSVAQWLSKEAKTGAKIGYDPKLHTKAELDQWARALKAKNITLVPVDGGNPLDVVWTDRPAAPASTVEVFPETIAGRSAADKREALAQAVRDAGGHGFVVAQPTSIAWLLNIRGTDVPKTPVALSYALVRDNGDVDLFIDPARVDAAVRAHLGNHVHIRKPEELDAALADLAQAAKAADKPVLIDPARAPVWFRMKLEKAGAKVADLKDPSIAARMIKTPQEKKSIIDTHVRDGVAMVRFLKWVEEEAPKGKLTELDVVERLWNFRKMDAGVRDDSFDTISGWAANGAVIHYRATPETNKAITPPGILLVDSGAQYQEGTTDITRTVAVGAPTDEMRENFTRVLKGHINLARAKFPQGTIGAAVDFAARRSLYEENLDFDHGTGHDVDCYLSVHGAGSVISAKSTVELKAGMLISNEPGFYKTGAYGIRIENLILVKEDGKRRETAKDVPMLRFETVTLAPIDRALIKPEIMDDAELQWLNDYHERVYQTLSPRLAADEAAWLRKVTQPLKKNNVTFVPRPGSSPQP